jgi:hypothetical protein
MIRNKPISSSKPGTANYYSKDAYKEISNYNKRRVDYFDDKSRWNSVYDKDLIKTVKEQNYADTKNRNKLEIDKYEYSHDENLKQIINEGLKKNEESVRTR